MTITKHKNWFALALLALLIGNTFAQSLSFELRNEKKSETSYSFDLLMKADQADTWHSRGQIYINYNPEAFGKAIVARGQVRVTPLDLLSETSALGAKYQTVNVADNGNRLAITWQSNFLGLAPSGATHTEVPLMLSPLYHVEIQFQDPEKAPMLDFNASLMKGQQFMLIGARQELPYGQTVAIQPAFLSFTATRANVHDVRLTWETVHEINCDHYVIEKQKNNGAFEALTDVEAHGLSQGTSSYAYLDQSGMANENYYRIKQIDLDGTFRYSQVERVEMEAVKNDRFVVFPSPAITEITLKAIQDLDADYSFSISDIQGKILHSGTLSQNGNPASKIDISTYAVGNYYICTQSPKGKIYLNRFIKVNK